MYITTHCSNRKKCWLPAFSPFPKCFQETSFNLPKQALVFTCLPYRSYENTVGKGEIALFYPIREFSAVSVKFQIVV